MKKLLLLSCSLALLGTATGFPTETDRAGEPVGNLRTTPAASRSKRLLVDPAAAPVEVTGEHAFVAPDLAGGDQRGPCPGLNALANHGYIRRDGVTSLAEVLGAMNRVFGMGLDVGGFLAALGTVFVGNPLAVPPGFSIGGADPAAAPSLLGGGGGALGLLGAPRGLAGSHNVIESDGSGTRADLYATGDASTMDLGMFRALHDEFAGGEQVDAFGVFAERAAVRFNESLMTNPDFYYGPWTGLIARSAGFFFASRCFANYSAENPQGVMTQDILKSFYAVEGDGDNLTYKMGHERIPENWYRTILDYDLVSFNLDLLALITKYPQLASIGGNTGTVDSFVGVDISDVTGGVLGATSLLEGNNLLCFTFEVVKTFAPNILSNILTTVAGPLEMVTNAVGSALLNISCPAFGDMTMGGKPLLKGLKDTFPGAAKSRSAL